MKALVTLSARFSQGPDGHFYTHNPSLTYNTFFWRYLDVFDEVQVLARCAPLSGAPIVQETCDGSGVTFLPVPSFSGVMDLWRSMPQIRARIDQGLSACRAVFLRVPDFLGSLTWRELRRRRRPFAVEVMGDPADGLAPGGVSHPLRPLVRLLAVRQLKAECRSAPAVTYVTQQRLQQKYPAGRQAITAIFSGISLPDRFFVAAPRVYSKPAQRLIFVSMMKLFYKGQVVLIEALSHLKEQGLPLYLTMVGDGERLAELEAMVREKGLESQVTFPGQIPAGTQVAAALDEAEIFLLPSLADGLPKALIEAMARGLPCIGSTVGGIPELLPPEDMVGPGDVDALAGKIKEVALDPVRLTRMSAQNLAKAQEYRADALQARRVQFYRQVMEISG
jgi:glycosyltransferase involved in cell wall biosynthesis